MEYVIIAEIIVWIVAGLVVVGLMSLFFIAGVMYFAKPYKIEEEKLFEEECDKWLDQ